MKTVDEHKDRKRVGAFEKAINRLIGPQLRASEKRDEACDRFMDAHAKWMAGDPDLENRFNSVLDAFTLAHLAYTFEVIAYNDQIFPYWRKVVISERKNANKHNRGPLNAIEKRNDALARFTALNAKRLAGDPDSDGEFNSALDSLTLAHLKYALLIAGIWT